MGYHFTDAVLDGDLDNANNWFDDDSNPLGFVPSDGTAYIEASVASGTLNVGSGQIFIATTLVIADATLTAATITDAGGSTYTSATINGSANFNNATINGCSFTDITTSGTNNWATPSVSGSLTVQGIDTINCNSSGPMTSLVSVEVQGSGSLTINYASSQLTVSGLVVDSGGALYLSGDGSTLTGISTLTLDGAVTLSNNTGGVVLLNLNISYIGTLSTADSIQVTGTSVIASTPGGVTAGSLVLAGSATWSVAGFIPAFVSFSPGANININGGGVVASSTPFDSPGSLRLGPAMMTAAFPGAAATLAFTGYTITINTNTTVIMQSGDGGDLRLTNATITVEPGATLIVADQDPGSISGTGSGWQIILADDTARAFCFGVSIPGHSPLSTALGEPSEFQTIYPTSYGSSRTGQYRTVAPNNVRAGVAYGPGGSINGTMGVSPPSPPPPPVATLLDAPHGSYASFLPRAGDQIFMITRPVWVTLVADPTEDLYYTLDGTDPLRSNTRLLYTVPFYVLDPGTLMFAGTISRLTTILFLKP